jgi:DNA-binding MarR family transcriptional regulator
VPDPQDRRAFAVKLTAAGRRAFADMAAVHEAWIEELLQDIPGEDKADMIAMLANMKHHLDERAGA